MRNASNVPVKTTWKPPGNGQVPSPPSGSVTVIVSGVLTYSRWSASAFHPPPIPADHMNPVSEVPNVGNSKRRTDGPPIANASRCQVGLNQCPPRTPKATRPRSATQSPTIACCVAHEADTTAATRLLCVRQPAPVCASTTIAGGARNPSPPPTSTLGPELVPSPWARTGAGPRRAAQTRNRRPIRDELRARIKSGRPARPAPTPAASRRTT